MLQQIDLTFCEAWYKKRLYFGASARLCHNDKIINFGIKPCANQELCAIMRTLLIIIFFLPIYCLGQKTLFNFEYTIVFGGNFNQDSIELKINNSKIFSGRIRSGVIAKANLEITQTKTCLSTFYNGATKKFKKSKTEPKLNIFIVLNGEGHSYSFDLKRGPILFVQNIYDKKLKANHLTIEQRTEPLQFL
jgi:hypothetical protein